MNSIVSGFWGVRYQVKDVAQSIKFYSEVLGLHIDQQRLPSFGQVSIEGLKLILSGPGASGSRAMPDGSAQSSGGWNRIVLQVDDLRTKITELENLGIHFRNKLEIGPGGKQIQIDDPDGNPIELFEPEAQK